MSFWIAIGVAFVAGAVLAWKGGQALRKIPPIQRLRSTADGKRPTTMQAFEWHALQGHPSWWPVLLILIEPVMGAAAGSLAYLAYGDSFWLSTLSGSVGGALASFTVAWLKKAANKKLGTITDPATGKSTDTIPPPVKDTR